MTPLLLPTELTSVVYLAKAVEESGREQKRVRSE
jgi:hypothetical protein